MDGTGLRKALGELGWSGAELGRRIGSSPPTVSSWTTGKYPVPGAVAAYVGLAVEVKRMAGGLEKAKRGKRR